jgi:hypothetical protein
MQEEVSYVDKLKASLPWYKRLWYFWLINLWEDYLYMWAYIGDDIYYWRFPENEDENEMFIGTIRTNQKMLSEEVE